MAKPKTRFQCLSCGATYAKWAGKCSACDAWNTLEEDAVRAASGASLERPKVYTLADELTMQHQERLLSGIPELDRVLGGGLVQDSFILLGGDPGIGKSTLLLQMAGSFLTKHANQTLFYASAEESVPQIQARARRLGLPASAAFSLCAATRFEVLEMIKEQKPHVVIVDSLQTFHLEGALPGTVPTLKSICNELMQIAKQTPCCVWLVGHVTKEGAIAGPKTVEHMVDTVLYFEGESHDLRYLRCVKNRFGHTRELGVFQMFQDGLKSVQNPSQFLLSESKGEFPGTAVALPIEGSRSFAVEFQALVTPTAVGSARRTASGFDSVRLSLLCAVLEKHARIKMSTYDLFFNVSGGFQADDPGCDLACLVAIWSSYLYKTIPKGVAFIGEISLTGEIRSAAHVQLRLDEASRLGMKRIVLASRTQDVELDASLSIQRIQSLRELPSLIGWD